MPAIKRINVSESWGNSMILNCEKPEVQKSAENFAEHCILKELRENKKTRTFIFDLTSMKFSASLQSLYCIAYYLIENSKLDSRDIVERVVLFDYNDPLMTNQFIQATFEATGEIKRIIGDYKWLGKEV